jgi:hypothetical protein
MLMGGTHSGNTGRQGVSVSTGGTFIMKGGSICNNFYFMDGAGVNVWGENSTFIMEDGQIFGNTAGGNSSGIWHGGGVNLMGGGTFIMKGGSIHGNKAYYGGGVGVSSTGGTFIMEGGSIMGNSDDLINLIPKNEANSGAAFYGELGTGKFGNGTVFTVRAINTKLTGIPAQP